MREKQQLRYTEATCKWKLIPNEDQKKTDMIHKEYNRDLALELAARLGLLVAASWSISFLVVVINFPSFISDFGYIIGLMSVLIVGRNIRGISSFIMPMNWSQRMLTAMMSFLGGALITTLVQYIYMAFFDHGMFINNMVEITSDPMFTDAIKQAGNADMLTTLNETLKVMQEMTPREFTMNLFSTNMTCVVILSLLASLFRGRPVNK